MRLLRNTLLILLVAGLATVSFAKKYSDAPAGQGTSTVGTGGDYASLSDASLDFNTTAATGSWTLEILNDLTETLPVYFGKTVDSSYVNTIKPASGTNPIVTFTASSTTLAGNLVFGAQGNDINVLYPTNNFVVDGSNNGTNSRNLTLVTDSSCNANYVYTVRVYGNSDNFTLRNCNVYFYSTTANNCAAIGFCSRVTTGDAASAFHPDNATIQNCYILSSTGKITAGSAMEFLTSGTLPAGSVATGFSINNCLVETYNTARSLYFNLALGQGVISNNTIHCTLPTGQTYGAYPINFNGSNNLNNMVVSGNVIDSIRNGRNATAGDAFVGINLCGTTGGGGKVGNFYVYNNSISGFELTGTPAAVALAFKGIRNYSSAEGFYVYNNSINIPAFAAGWTALGASYGIGLESGAYAGHSEIKNNIVRINAGKNFSCIWKINSSSTTDANITFDNNVYAPLSGATVARFGGNYYSTLSAYQAAYPAYDVHSEVLDPLATAPGHWISETNLHFSSAEVDGLLHGTPITSPVAVSTDIDGDTRDALAPWPGIDENGTLVPVELSDFITE
jgi:hypothetical protein